ncbi:hypothetical protein AAT19DRAFT_9410 [Rhodotorula toruloides]|uniref:Secreted protein n=1 Tax=Rhodotorula toruloides TaxID=5286 RepID=A0A2T0A249_RHOTO|nr:hypothetical protein AAT19DRAFT_9410 [Rhodotorula toruloides]
MVYLLPILRLRLGLALACLRHQSLGQMRKELGIRVVPLDQRHRDDPHLIGEGGSPLARELVLRVRDCEPLGAFHDPLDQRLHARRIRLAVLESRREDEGVDQGVLVRLGMVDEGEGLEGEGGVDDFRWRGGRVEPSLCRRFGCVRLRPRETAEDRVEVVERRGVHAVDVAVRKHVDSLDSGSASSEAGCDDLGQSRVGLQEVALVPLPDGVLDLREVVRLGVVGEVLEDPGTGRTGAEFAALEAERSSQLPLCVAVLELLRVLRRLPRLSWLLPYRPVELILELVLDKLLVLGWQRLSLLGLLRVDWGGRGKGREGARGREGWPWLTVSRCLPHSAHASRADASESHSDERVSERVEPR